MARDRRSVKSIFDEAAEIASPEERAAYLERYCGEDLELRKNVDALLRALDEAFHAMIEKSRAEQAPLLDVRCDRLARLRHSRQRRWMRPE